MRLRLLLILAVLLPTAAYAQSSVTGIVKDASGAILPGVTVEAASPALILRLGQTKLNLAVDLLNALNLSTIIIPNQAFIPNGAWLTPTGTQTPIMTARTAKFTIQYDF